MLKSVKYSVAKFCNLVTRYMYVTTGGLAERPNAAVLKTVGRSDALREFESHTRL